MNWKILEYDEMLKPFAADIQLRMDNYERKKKELLADGTTLKDFANGHEYFGFHKSTAEPQGWFYREWAPAAEEVYLTGDFNNWHWLDHKLTNIGNGVWEIFIPGTETLWHGCKVKTIVKHNGQLLERIPTYARRVVQDPATRMFCCEIVDEAPYQWKKKKFTPAKELFIYECHIGMAQEEEKVGSYIEFRDNILPRIKEAGYNTIQIMAIMEHPYYGSFGYQVSNFFAASSRFGLPNDLKSLIDTAHEMGIAVLLDVVHSHAVKNTAEGLNEFDGTTYQFFHDGPKGDHPAWGTKLFNYNKNEVIHFLLSNLKFWMDEYHFDGFRFDGVTSMLYHDHGLGVAFDGPEKYFSMNTDIEAITYLQLATELIKEVNPKAICIAEDMSAMPGMCLPIADGGVGFDYRLSMGMPDLWIRLLKETPDEFWNIHKIWYELQMRRPMEKNIGYAESHDQALVGDKTIMFRLCDAAMYTDMDKASGSIVVDRGVALHKMIRLISMAAGGEGYLNFMGNEFGHPEWIDFPREGNGWSHYYCRRQWSLVDNGYLRYGQLNEFDKAMVNFAKEGRIHKTKPEYMMGKEDKQVLVFERGGKVFAFNFSPFNAYDDYIRVPTRGEYKVALSTDEERFGGFGGVSLDYVYKTEKMEDGNNGFKIYLPARTAVCIEKVKKPRKAKEAVAEEVVTEKPKAKRGKKAEIADEAVAEKPKTKRTRKAKAE